MQQGDKDRISQPVYVLAPVYPAQISQERHVAAYHVWYGRTSGDLEQITWRNYVPADFVFYLVLLFRTDRVLSIAEVNGSNLMGVAPVLWR